MKQYPKTIKTKQDIENILKDHPEWAEQLRQDMGAVLNEPDIVTRATTLIDPNDETAGWNTETIPNPSPRWKRMGFDSKAQIRAMIQQGGI